MPIKTLPSNEILEEFFKYDTKSGVLYWKKDPPKGSRKKGKPVGCVDNDGYLVTTLQRIAYKVHRIVYKYVTKSEPPSIIDHINGNKSDNRIENLRSGENKVNMRNKIKSRLVHDAGYFVFFHKLSRKYALVYNKHHIALFSTQQEAIDAIENKPRCRHDYCKSWDKKEGVVWHSANCKWQIKIPKRFRRSDSHYLPPQEKFEDAVLLLGDYIEGKVK